MMLGDNGEIKWCRSEFFYEIRQLFMRLPALREPALMTSNRVVG